MITRKYIDKESGKLNVYYRVEHERLPNGKWLIPEDEVIPKEHWNKEISNRDVMWQQDVADFDTKNWIDEAEEIRKFILIDIDNLNRKVYDKEKELQELDREISYHSKRIND